MVHSNLLKMLDVSGNLSLHLLFFSSYFASTRYVTSLNPLRVSFNTTSAKRGTSLVHSSTLTMSLLEDIRDVLYIIFEYFGVPPDMVSALHISSISIKGIFVLYVSVLVWFHVLSLVAGSSVGQSAVWFVSQHRAHDWNQPPTGTFTESLFSGTCIIKSKLQIYDLDSVVKLI